MRFWTNRNSVGSWNRSSVAKTTSTSWSEVPSRTPYITTKSHKSTTKCFISLGSVWHTDWTRHDWTRQENSYDLDKLFVWCLTRQFICLVFDKTSHLSGFWQAKSSVWFLTRQWQENIEFCSVLSSPMYQMIPSPGPRLKIATIPCWWNLQIF